MRCPHCTDGLVPRGDTDPLRDLGSPGELCSRCGGSGQLSEAQARRIAKADADAKEAAQRAAIAAIDACFVRAYHRTSLNLLLTDSWMRGLAAEKMLERFEESMEDFALAAAGAYC